MPKTPPTLPQADPPADLELFATGADGTISHLRFHDGRWDPPTTLAGLLSIGPVAPAERVARKHAVLKMTYGDMAPMLVKGRSAEVTACRIGGAVRS